MSSPSAQAVPAPSDLPSIRLAALRSELDRVDDALHDALMRRAELVTQVGALRAKGKVPLRPGREAAIIRRLLARNRGALAPALLVRIWREIVSGSSAQQQEMLVAVDDLSLLPMISAHFGSLVPAEAVAGAEAALGLLMSGRATVAVLRWPGDWWRALLDGRAAAVHVVARLPFWGEGDEAMVLTLAPPDPSGDDRTLIGARVPEGLLAAFGGEARVLAPGLIEVDGFVTADDARLAATPCRVLGAYATQLGVIG